MHLKRRFIPGEEWLYVKIYSGPEMLESILKREIHSIIEMMSTAGMINNFFFVRFADKEGIHTRLRFHITDPAGTGKIISLINHKLSLYVDKRMVFRIVYDTYNRELERYGEVIMEDTEILFGFSSWGILSWLKYMDDHDLADNRWAWGARLMDEVLDRFNIPYAERHELCERYYRMYTREFGLDKRIKDLLSAKYREYVKGIEDVMLKNNEELQDVESMPPFFSGSEVEDAVRRIILHFENSGKDGLHNYLSSIMHMHYNRLFISQQRPSEFIIYYILSKLYKSITIRKKNQVVQ
jgi:thiopeptide-type bacteriocin biosynthesis protein